MQGVALGLYDDRDKAPALAEIAALGADHVSLVVAWRQKDVRSVALAPSPSTVGDERLRVTVRAARAAGLEVLILPHRRSRGQRPGAWRGTLAPADVDAWCRATRPSFSTMRAWPPTSGAELFAIGSELASTESWRRPLVPPHLCPVKRRYRGKLVYSANWDHYSRGEASGAGRLPRGHGVPRAHHPGTTPAPPSSEASWRRVRDELVQFAAAVGRPLVLTEVGYPSQDGAAVHPWITPDTPPSTSRSQRRAYAAFVAAWKDEPVSPGPHLGVERRRRPRDAATRRAASRQSKSCAASIGALPRALWSVDMEGEPTDETLMIAYLAGDHSAFESLFRRLAPRCTPSSCAPSAAARSPTISCRRPS